MINAAAPDVESSPASSSSRRRGPSTCSASGTGMGWTIMRPSSVRAGRHPKQYSLRVPMGRENFSPHFLQRCRGRVTMGLRLLGSYVLGSGTFPTTDR